MQQRFLSSVPLPFVLFRQQGTAKKKVEKLGRGVVAIRSSATNVFISVASAWHRTF
jgi:hypothetical protein